MAKIVTFREQLDMFSNAPNHTPRARAKTKKRVLKLLRKPQTIQERFDAFAQANPKVLTRALQIAREWMIRGDRYISVKAIYETMRTNGDAIDRGTDAFRLNNSYTAGLSAWLLRQEPELVGIIRTRERKS
jgi:hypothetical protein